MARWKVEYDQRGTYTGTYEIEADSAGEAEERLLELIGSEDPPEPVHTDFYADASEHGIDYQATSKVSDGTREAPAQQQHDSADSAGR